MNKTKNNEGPNVQWYAAAAIGNNSSIAVLL